jgi:hypothetical protein
MTSSQESGPAHRATVLSASTPEDLLAAVPIALGFDPLDSVVMLTFGGVESFQARLDLPAGGGAGEVDEVGRTVRQLLEPAQQHRVTQVVFVLYAEDGTVVRALARGLREAFAGSGIAVLEVLRAHQGRWFAPGRPGAPPRGVPYDVGGHRFRVQAVVEGIVVHRSREELEAVLAPVAGAVAETSRALRLAVPSSPGEVADLVDRRLDGGRFTTLELARVLLGLLDHGGREAALAAMTRDLADQHQRLWTDAVQRAPEELSAEPTAVLALAAWLAGQGALAWCAVDRCRASDPGNSLAELVAEVLTRAVPPSAWTRAQAG